MNDSEQQSPTDKKVCSVKIGRNAPFYRSKEQKADLLSKAAEEAVLEAVEEHDARYDRLRLDLRWKSSRLEPQCEYGEVIVRER